jgi:hypothetical protein
MDRVGLVEISEFLGSPERQNVGQTVTWRFIGSPATGHGCRSRRRREPGQAFTGPVPDNDAPLIVKHERRNDEVLHQPRESDHGILFFNFGGHRLRWNIGCHIAIFSELSRKTRSAKNLCRTCENSERMRMTKKSPKRRKEIRSRLSRGSPRPPAR